MQSQDSGIVALLLRYIWRALQFVLWPFYVIPPILTIIWLYLTYDRFLGGNTEATSIGDYLAFTAVTFVIGSIMWGIVSGRIWQHVTQRMQEKVSSRAREAGAVTSAGGDGGSGGE